MSKGALWPQLDALDRRVLEARDRLETLTAERGRLGQRVERALAPLRDYHRAIGAGEREPDPDEEARLRADAEAAQGGVRMVARHQRGGPQRGTDLIDDALDAQISGAAEAKEQVEQERAMFLREHRAALEVELRPAAEKARDGVNKAFDVLRGAEREWMTVLQRAARVADGRKLPPNPLHGLSPSLDRDGAALPLALAERPAPPPDPHPDVTFRPATPSDVANQDPRQHIEDSLVPRPRRHKGPIGR